MRTTTLILVLLLAAGAAFGAEMGESAGHDLDELWQQARKTYDLDREDAVLLLESRHVTVSDDGALATRVHRVVWIGTARGIREYADLRVPWNSATSTLNVEILRTWRDERWWPDAQRVSETAVVHTLPYAVDHADDYTAMRETMLLHDGVELPCIMETAYTIAEQGSPAAGAGGFLVLPQRDPAVLTEYVVRAPTGAEVRTEELNGAPQPRTRDGSGVGTLTWTVEKSPALALPRTGFAAAYEPTVAWSTWESWERLAEVWTRTFDAAAVVSGALTDTVATRLDHLATEADRARAVVAFVAEGVRTIHYDDRFWRLAPRGADRTWDTGYGHALDKGVLLTALLRELGWQVRPVFVNDAVAPALPTTACFAGLGHPLLQARKESGLGPLGDVAILCDPERGTVHTSAYLRGRRATWFGEDFARDVDPGRTSTFVLTARLEPGPEDGWTGSAQLDADAVFNYQDASAGEAGLAAHLGGVVGSVLPGAEIGDVRPRILDPQQASTSCGFTLPAGDEDQTRLVVGQPSGGLLEQLPDDVDLHAARRGSPVLLSTPLVQNVVVVVKLGEQEVVHRPAELQLKNGAGRFSVTCAVENGVLKYTRMLTVDGDRIAAKAWPDLRALLLEEADAANATIILE